jgi:hypothetical protein
MLKKSLALTAAAVVAGVMALSGSGTANAMRPIFIPRMHGGMPMHRPMMQAPMMGSHMNGTHMFHSGDGDWWRRRHHHHDRDFAFLGFGFPYDDDYYYPSYSDDAHVRWCLDHYRTYDPRTNTFIGIDGYRHACIGRYYY